MICWRRLLARNGKRFAVRASFAMLAPDNALLPIPRERWDEREGTARSLLRSGSSARPPSFQAFSVQAEAQR